MTSPPFVFGFAGWSGSGKTTLAEKIIARAEEASLHIATIKHAHHHFDADREGKDSWRHRKAGARQVLVASDNRMALFTEKPKPQKPELADLLGRLDACDWVLVEGFKHEPITKIEIFDAALGETPFYKNDPHIIAVISQSPLSDCPLPVFDRDDVAGIFAFLQQRADKGGEQGQ